MLRPYFERTNEGVVKPIATVAMIQYDVHDKPQTKQIEIKL